MCTHCLYRIAENLHGAKNISYACSTCKNKSYEDLNDRNFSWTLASLHAVKIEYGELVFCQIFKRPTQRLLISCTIETEAKKAYKPWTRSPCCAVGHRWAIWAWLIALAYEIKLNTKFYSVGFWPDIWKFAPTKISCYTVQYFVEAWHLRLY